MDYLSLAVHALPTEEGGRSTPFAGRRGDSGASYRPHLRVPPGGGYLGVAFVDGPEWIAPGEDAVATVALIYLEHGVDYGALVTGVRTEIVEGPRVIATARVLDRWTEATDWHTGHAPVAEGEKSLPP